jgi:hypothetical protein
LEKRKGDIEEKVRRGPTSLSLSVGTLTVCVAEQRLAAQLARERANAARQAALGRRADDELSGKGRFDTLPVQKAPKQVPTAPASLLASSSSASAVSAAKKPTPPAANASAGKASTLGNSSGGKSSDFGNGDLDLLDDLFDDKVEPAPEPKKMAPQRTTSTANLNKSNSSGGSAASSVSSPVVARGGSAAAAAASKKSGDDGDDMAQGGADGGDIDLNTVRGTIVLRIYLKKDDTYKTLGVSPTATVREVCFFYVQKMRLNTDSKHFAMIEWTSGDERYMMPHEKPGQMALDWKAKSLSADEKRLYFAFSEATKNRLSKTLSSGTLSSSGGGDSTTTTSKAASGGDGGATAADLSDLDALDDLLDEPKKPAPARQSSASSGVAAQRTTSSSNIAGAARSAAPSGGATSAHRIGTDPFGGKLDIVAAMQKQNSQKAKTGSAGDGGGALSPRALSPTPQPAANPSKPNRAVGGAGSVASPTPAPRAGAVVSPRVGAAGAAGRGAGASSSKTNISSAADAALDDLDSFLGDFDAPAPTKKAPARQSAAPASKPQQPADDLDFLDDFASAATKKAPANPVSKAPARNVGRATPTPPAKSAAAAPAKSKMDELDDFAAEFGGGDDDTTAKADSYDTFGDADDLPPPPKKTAPVKAAAAAAAAKKPAPAAAEPSGEGGEFDDLLGDLAGQMEDIDSMLDF